MWRLTDLESYLKCNVIHTFVQYNYISGTENPGLVLK
jgi:hypothetical protein